MRDIHKRENRILAILIVVAMALLFISHRACTTYSQESRHRSPELSALYDDINFRYFKARLPKLPVYLCDGSEFLYDERIVCVLEETPRSTRMNLFHEMVHVEQWVDNRRDGSTIEFHTPEDTDFQVRMQRLAQAGAFRGSW